jgi:hypothetical protein
VRDKDVERDREEEEEEEDVADFFLIFRRVFLRSGSTGADERSKRKKIISRRETR